MHNKKYFSIDFVKFMLVAGLMFRHAPLFLYSGSISEYIVSDINPFTVFLPVTSGFIFILGYSLGVSKSVYNRVKFKSHINIGLKLFTISIIMAIASYFLREIDISFVEFYFQYQWDTPNKPGYYILLQIACFYIITAFIRAYSGDNLKNNMLVLLLIVLILRLITDLYFFHYLFFGFLGFSLSQVPFFYKGIEKFNGILFTFTLLFYFILLKFIGQVNIFTEMFLLILFVYIFASAASLINVAFLKKIITYLSSEILFFYLIHIVLLNLLGRYIQLDGWGAITVFCLCAIVSMIPIVFMVRTFIHKSII